MPSYLQKRRRRWYAVLEIPKALRRHFGKSRFVKSLETESRSVAERRVHTIVAGWKRDIASARNEPCENDAAYFARQLRHANTESQRLAIKERIEERAWDIGATNVDEIGQSPSSDPEARAFVAEAIGVDIRFTSHLDEWLETSGFTDKTKDMYRSAVLRFGSDFRLVSEVTRKRVRRWVNKLLIEENLTPSTIQRILSSLRSYWSYLKSLDEVEEGYEPFSGLKVAPKVQRDAPARRRLPFDPTEVRQLHLMAVEARDSQLADLICLGMWTGCRIEELCALRTDDVHDTHFVVTDAKTNAGDREVPIHKRLKPVMKRLLKASKDGFVLSGLSENKYGDRSNAIGKRFGRLKKDAGYGHQHVFHSIRKTVVTILENAGVPENVVADIVGHEKTTMTYGLYSGGISLKLKSQAIQRLNF
ncbi:MAG: tyrosine-type recombinase/integrase [Pseudomonadota bacterium]|nr:tyrosine-type recombinase/integrase [Pseudomonadota bacterium]